MSGAADIITGSGGDLGQVQVAMLKKAQNAEATSANQLIQQLPPPPRSASPAGVGSKVDFTA